MNTLDRIRKHARSWLSKLVRGNEEEVARLHCCTPDPLPSEQGSAHAGSPDADER